MSDEIRVCVKCGRKFVWSYGEQRHFREMGFQPPKHCKKCASRRWYEGDTGDKGMSGSPSGFSFIAPDIPATPAKPTPPSQPARPGNSARPGRPTPPGATSPVQADFDRIALLPEVKWDHNIHYHDFLLNHVPSHCEEVLEIGCGTGAFTRLLAQRSEHVVAIDLSPYMVRAARERSAEYPNIDYYIEEAQKYRFPVGQLDCIVSIATLHHLPFEKMLFKFKTALKPNGVLLILDLYQQEGLAGWLTSVLALPVDVALRLVKLGRLQDPEETRAAWTMHGQHDSYMTLTQIRQVCAAVLPGAQVRQHLLWRYSIVWNKT